VTAFLARLGDRINPIVVKEARQAVNSRLVSAALLLFLGVQLAVMMVMLAGREAPGTDQLDLRAGREVFIIVQGILVGTCMLLIPAMTGIRLGAERSDVNVDLLFISSLTPRAIVAGKLVAAAAVALLIFSACAPFMTFAYVLRGLDVPTIVVVLAADFLIVVTATALAVFLASIPAGRGFRLFFGIFGLIALCYVGGGALAGGTAFLQGEMREDTSSWEFWAAFAGLAAAVTGFTGLLFVWSVAMVSPAASNRALPVRVYTLGYWLVAGVGCVVWGRQISHAGPAVVWGMFGAVLFSLQFLISASERDGWGPRVARRIPRRALLRAPAFFLYSGAAGGLLFGVLGGALSVGGLLAWHGLTPAAHWPTRWWQPAQLGGLILAYTYCYCLTAELVRRMGRGTSMRPGLTWLVALVIFGLGCTLPFIAGYAFFESQTRYRYPDELMWLYLPSPVVMVPDSLNRQGVHDTMLMTFLAAWAAVVTLLNAGWLLRQVSDFVPPKDKPSPNPLPSGERGLEPPAVFLPLPSQGWGPGG
jgi:hypothetical protein